MNEKTGATRALKPGTLVHNRYQVLKSLGEGGFGVTYQVLDSRDGSLGAMKEYMPGSIAFRDPRTQYVLPRKGYEELYGRLRDQFLEEARIIYQYLGHPNIIRVRHLFYGNNTAYYVMEYMEGQDLSRYLSIHGSRMDWEHLRPIAAQIAQALQMVHSSGIVHCDISPDNIFLLEGGQAKLIDFGAAKNIYHEDSSVMLLKRFYAPPEQQSGTGELGPWTDLYALGVTIYRCMTGVLPPGAEERSRGKPVVWPSEMGISVPSSNWETALQRVMSLDPEKRFRTSMDFFHALESRGGSTLVGRKGFYQGRSLQVDRTLVLGTDPARCNVVFPRGTPGVSRAHLQLWSQNGGLMVRDLGSTYGTWLDGSRLKPGVTYAAPGAGVLYFGDNQCFQILEG